MPVIKRIDKVISELQAAQEDALDDPAVQVAG